jgi:integrase
MCCVSAQARVDAKAAATPRKSFTVSEALGTYWNDVCQHQSSASTAKSQAAAILRAIPAKTRVPDLNNAALARMVAKMRAGVKNSTVNRRIDMLARSIRYMVKVHEAEVADLDFNGLKLREKQERVRELSADEERRLFENLRSDLHPLVKFALMTGKRREEICSLRWEDVDKAPNRIVFRVKGGKIHRLPITRDMRVSMPK